MLWFINGNDNNSVKRSHILNSIDNGEKIYLWKKQLTEQRIPKNRNKYDWNKGMESLTHRVELERFITKQNCFIESLHFGNARGFSIDSIRIEFVLVGRKMSFFGFFGCFGSHTDWIIYYPRTVIVYIKTELRVVHMLN